MHDKIHNFWHNKGSTELYCLFVAADTIMHAVNFTGDIVVLSENTFSRNLAQASFEFRSLTRSVFGPISDIQIRYNHRKHSG